MTIHNTFYPPEKMSEKGYLKRFKELSKKSSLETAFQWLRLDWSDGIPMPKYTLDQRKVLDTSLLKLSNQVTQCRLGFSEHVLSFASPTAKSWREYHRIVIFEQMVHQSRKIVEALPYTDLEEKDVRNISFAYRGLIEWEDKFMERTYGKKGSEKSALKSLAMGLRFVVGVGLAAFIGGLITLAILIISDDNLNFVDILDKMQ